MGVPIGRGITGAGQIARIGQIKRRGVQLGTGQAAAECSMTGIILRIIDSAD